MCLNHGSSTLRLKAWMSASLGWYSRSVRTAPGGSRRCGGPIAWAHRMSHREIPRAPGARKPAVVWLVDLLMPPMLSRYRISGWELASLGHGGLLG